MSRGSVGGNRIAAPPARYRLPRQIATLFIASLLCGACASSPQPAGVSRHAGGPIGDTWIGLGESWHQVEGPHPAPRYSASLAYDAAHNVFVLFGGQTATEASDETWTWDGGRWTEKSPSHKPAARRMAAMAYDPRQKVVVLYGGWLQRGPEGSPASDTWTWDGSDWTQVQVAATDPVPGTRIGARMVTAGTEVILFGGSVAPNSDFSADAWTWQGGKRWVRLDRNPTPEGRNNAAVAWDTADSSLFVYGGSGLNPEAGGGAAGKALADAWSLKNGTWNPIMGSGPPALTQASAVWDRSSQRVVVMFGMSGTTCPNPTNTVWAWDGTNWSALADAKMPRRWGAAVAQDDSGNALVFGGSDEPGC
jgi:hypothetical protein